jgi:hypothetical protein
MTPEDRELLVTLLEGLPRGERQSLEVEARERLQEAGGASTPELVAGQVAELVLRRSFGPARSRQYLRID